MAHAWDKHYNKVFVTLIIIGIGLCIGGIWLPPLLIPGGVVLAGALSMYASAYTRMYPWRQDNPAEPIPTQAPTLETIPLQRPNTPNLSHESEPDIAIMVGDTRIDFHPHYEARRHHAGSQSHGNETHSHAGNTLTLS